MGIEVSVTREFAVNGRPYRSLEEAPPEFRDALRGAPASRRGEPEAGGCGGIVVNGQRCDDFRPDPDDVREIYAVAMQCIASGKDAPRGKPAAGPQPIAPQGSTSRRLMLGGLLLCLFASLILLLLPR
ncbi:MAG: hypothetical protein A4E73_01824 [Syntrophaceae bacterium PtaU1.Bin231]|nr:MAG: hypothetical protein A4E73_01824 [Syntrophaceae bacterium PtaU1.Bin231]